MVNAPRSARRFGVAVLAAAVGCGGLASKAEAAPKQVAQQTQQAGEPAEKGDFRGFIESLWPEAQSRGISRATFETAFRGVALDPKVVGLTRKQSEFNQPIW